MFRMVFRVLFALALLLGTSAYALEGRLLFTLQEGTSGAPDVRLYLLEIELGGVPVDITPSGADGASPVWSPDGSRILFSSLKEDDPNFDVNLYTMNPDGSDLKQITDTPGIEDDPAWSPDGWKIAYFIGNHINGNRSLWVLDLQSGKTQELVPSGGNLNINVSRAAWSPDGNQVAFNAIGAANRRGLYTVRIDTKVITPVNEGLFQMALEDWLPTNELLVNDGSTLKLGILSSGGEFTELFPEIQTKFVIHDARGTLRWPDLIAFSGTPLEGGSSGKNRDSYSVKRDGTGLRLLADMELPLFSSTLWYDARDVTPADQLPTTWGEVKTNFNPSQ